MTIFYSVVVVVVVVIIVVVIVVVVVIISRGLEPRYSWLHKNQDNYTAL